MRTVRSRTLKTKTKYLHKHEQIGRMAQFVSKRSFDRADAGDDRQRDTDGCVGKARSLAACTTPISPL